MVFGTFDILHPGHKYLFKEAKKHGDYLIAVIARDKTVKQVKGRCPDNDENKRLSNISKFVDKAVLGSLDSKTKVIEELRPDVICLGYDQDNFVDELNGLIKDYSLNIPIIRLKPFKEHIYKGSLLRKSFK